MTEFTEVFTEVFITGELTETNEAKIIAEAFNAWALCKSGNTPPKNFGKGRRI